MAQVMEKLCTFGLCTIFAFAVVVGGNWARGHPVLVDFWPMVLLTIALYLNANTRDRVRALEGHVLALEARSSATAVSEELPGYGTNGRRSRQDVAALRAEVERLRAALELFAGLDPVDSRVEPTPPGEVSDIPASAIRAAKAAAEKGKGPR